ncbi:hypothetical protein DFJ73DRAFT_807711 [Zopfochytrium polystomum]|nr:hypothetical protein DFJ73DRAFT_807711 [Zopfochytrium polystomum]
MPFSLVNNGALDVGCFNLTSSATCLQWVAAMQPLALPNMAAVLVDLGSSALQINSVASFDSAIETLRFTDNWASLFGCSGLSSIPASRPFPVRFAESYACASTLSNVVRGSSAAFPQCVMGSGGAVKVRSLCKETCVAFATSFAALRNENGTANANCQSDGDAGTQAVQSFQTQSLVFSDLCKILKSSNDPVADGDLPCVKMSLRDFVSCGFGNNTAGLAAAKTYCDGLTNKDTCCSYLGASVEAANVALGGTIRSGATGSANPAADAGTIIGILVAAIVAVGAAFGITYKYYRTKRNRETPAGFVGSNGGPAVGPGGKVPNGIVVGAGSRLSFAPSNRRYQNLHELSGGGSQATITPPRKAASLGPGAYGNSPSPASSKRLGPNAAGDFGSFGSLGRSEEVQMVPLGGAPRGY